MRRIVALFSLVLSVVSMAPAYSADLYWRATPLNNDFNNIGNWGVGAPNGPFPGIAPGTGDNVFFTISSSITNLTSSTNINCANFTCTAPVAFTYDGADVNINGNLSLNGNFTFHASQVKTISFIGSGVHTINTGGSSVYLNSDVRILSGNYTLVSNPLVCHSLIINSGCTGFSSSGLNITVASVLHVTNGSALRNINFNGSVLSFRNSAFFNGDRQCLLQAPNNTYSFTGTHILFPTGISRNGRLFADNGLNAPIDQVTTYMEIWCRPYDINTTGNLAINTLNVGGHIKFYQESASPTSKVIIQNLNFITGAMLEMANRKMLQGGFECGNITISSTCATGKPMMQGYLGKPKVRTLNPVNVTGLACSRLEVTGAGFTVNNGLDLGFNSGIVFSGVMPSQTYYWIGGAGNWTDPSHWSLASGGAPNPGGCIPTLNDDVFFDANSFSANGQVVSGPISADVFCRDLNWLPGPMSGEFRSATSTNTQLNIAGSMNITGMQLSNGVTPRFLGPGAHSLTCGGKFFNSFYYFEHSGTYSLADNFVTHPSNGLVHHSSGSLVANGFNFRMATYQQAYGITDNNFYDHLPKALNLTGQRMEITQNDNGFGYKPWYVFKENFTLISNGSEIYFSNTAGTGGITMNTISSSLQPTLVYNNVTFNNNGATVSCEIRSGGTGADAQYNLIKFVNTNGFLTGNGNQGVIDSLQLTGGYTYTLQSGVTNGYVLTGDIVVPGACNDFAIIKSSVLGSQAYLRKNTGNINCGPASVEGLNITGGFQLLVSAGLDNGNNTNVTVNPLLSRDFYWRGNSGDWTDGSHWAINNPADVFPTVVSNPGGCIPTSIDNVYLDGASFSLSGQTIGINGVANCKNFQNDAASSVFLPNITGPLSASWNIYGSLDLTPGLNGSGFNGTVYFKSTQVAPPNSVDFADILFPGKIVFDATGRWDLMGPIRNYPGPSNSGVFLDRGQLYTNNYDILSNSFQSTTTVPRMLSLGNSDLFLYNTLGLNLTNLSFINGEPNLHGMGPNTAFYSINGNPQTFHWDTVIFVNPGPLHTITMMPTDINVLDAQNSSVLDFSSTSSSVGNHTIDIVKLKGGGVWEILANSEITINDTLISNGTPCALTTIRSRTSGSRAKLRSPDCQLELAYVRMKDIEATITSCGSFTPVYHFLGDNQGNVVNWAYSSVSDLDGLNIDTTVSCRQIPLSIDAYSGFGPALSYLWSTGTLGSVETFNHPGVYGILVTYAAGCTSADTIRIDVDSNSIQLDSILVHPTCFGFNNGSLQLLVDGANDSLYVSVWSSPTGDPFTVLNDTTITGLSAGTYHVVLAQTNFSGCRDSMTVVVTEPAPLVLNATVSNVLCNGGGNGSIVAAVTGGTPGYQISFENGAFAPSPQSYPNLPAGTYQLVMQDANGCRDTVQRTVIEPAVLNATTTPQPVLCFGGSTGAIGLSVNGGTPLYSVSMNGGGFNPVQSSYTGLTAGSYQFVIQDANNCRDTVVQTITQPSALSVTPSQTTILCNGGTFTASVSVSGATPGYTYTWSHNGALNNDTAMGLPSGSYTVTITDNNNCSATQSFSATQPSAFSVIPDQTAILCNGGTSTASVSVSGATPGYTYSWSHNGALNNDTASGLSPGSYTVTITDANNCSTTQSFAITQPSLLTAVPNQTPILCNGGTSVASVSVSGATPGYTYSWSHNAALNNDTATGLSVGSYTVTITDNNNCTATQSFTITQPSAFSVTPAQSPVLCHGGTSTAAVSVSGATPGYTYTWSHNAVLNNDTASGLTVGSYTVTITDNNNCTISEVFVITEPTQLVNAYTQLPSACDSATGSVFISTSGGTPGYSYSWGHDILLQNDSATNVPPGGLQVVITDANNCADTVLLVMNTVGGPLTFTSSSDVLCFGDSSGYALVDSVQGNGGFGYTWTDGSLSIIASGGPMVSDLAAGMYMVWVEDTNGCVTVDTVNISEPSAPVSVVTSVANTIDCFGWTNGSLTASGTGGTGTIQYAWNTVPQQNGAAINNLSPGQYIVTATDSNGCVAVDSVTLSAPPELISAASTVDVLCNGGTDGSAWVEVSGGAPGYDYDWVGQSDSDSLLQNASAGGYTVIITDQNGCKDTVSVTITEPDAIAIVIGDTILPVCDQSNGSIDITVSGGISAYVYQWTNGSTTEDLADIPSGSYGVTVTDQNGCSRSLSLNLECDAVLHIPQVLTPNSDGMNDVWFIEGLENYPSASVEIFNRWGNRVFYQNPYQNNWDGTSNNGALGSGYLPDATYFFILDLGNGTQPISNYLELQR